MNEQEQIVWAMPSWKLMESLHRTFRGEHPNEVILDLWDERDPDSGSLTIHQKEE